ncbi:CapA family protein [Halorarius litoreus]|uniref:CapA family protein n=1 Tax=Halorarius litoreus TaxID=2962676 RepID=UPI0020CF15DB|nr:CapA family protein [Halorarius litoreus]
MTQPPPAGQTDADHRLFVAGDVICPPELSAPFVAPALQQRIEQADLSVVNLEAPVDPKSDPIEKSGPAKRSAADTTPLLREAGFDLATLANNHVMDYGADGLRRTIRECDREDIATCGAGGDHDAALEPHRTTLGDTSLAVFSVCEQEFGVADAASPGTAWGSHPSVRRRIAEESRRSDVVVVVAHGGVEYVPFPPPQRQTRLREFVEAGADLVVGHHPHVPQGWEVHKGTPIFYSLGNFRFDQPNRPKTSWGLALDVGIADGETLDVDLVPTELVDGTVQEVDTDRAVDEHLQYLYRVTERTAPQDTLRGYWQETAMQLFDQRYSNWLRRGTGARARDQVTTPTQHVSTEAAWGEGRRDEMLVLLNLFRNESHRSVVETALALKTGDCVDHRTEEIREEVRELVAWTEDRPFYDTPSPPRAKLAALGSLLSERLPTGSENTSDDSYLPHSGDGGSA